MKKTFNSNIFVPFFALALLCAFYQSEVRAAQPTVTAVYNAEGIIYQGTGFAGQGSVLILADITNPNGALNTATFRSSPVTSVIGDTIYYYDHVSANSAEGTVYSYNVYKADGSGAATGSALASGSFTVNTGTAVHDPGNPGTSGTSNIHFKIDNPVSSFDDINSLIVELLTIIMMVVGPVIAVMIIYAGFLFVTARGDTAKMDLARKTLLYVVIGAAIILGAKVIATAIQGTVSSLI